jgi:hypothetical protein
MGRQKPKLTDYAMQSSVKTKGVYCRHEWAAGICCYPVEEMPQSSQRSGEA